MNIMKKYIPLYMKRIYRRFLMMIRLLYSYYYDFKRYYRFSDYENSDRSDNLIGRIIREYHVIEKGLTMPERRLGFGQSRIISLCRNCHCYFDMYGFKDEQLSTALEVIAEYDKFHVNSNFKLDVATQNCIDTVKTIQGDILASLQRNFVRDSYFSHTGSSFGKFSESRRSVRNFIEEDICLEDILKSLEIAKSAPSACNRQCWRTYIVSSKERISKITEVQGGSRGFGYLANKLIVVTGKIGGFYGHNERNQVFIDCGIYTMNLLYALHYHHIATCVLNCSTTPQKDKQLRKEIGIDEGEVFIAIIACGNPPESFYVTNSKRYDVSYTNSVLSND